MVKFASFEVDPQNFKVKNKLKEAKTKFTFTLTQLTFLK